MPDTPGPAPVGSLPAGLSARAPLGRDSVTIGVDFGTTNSVVARLGPDGSVTTARGPGAAEVFRSVLCFWPEEAPGRAALRHAAGPAAIEAYLDDPLGSRLLLSLKSYLAQRSVGETRVFGRAFTVEALVALLLRAVLEDAGVDPAGARVVAGRPVRFVGETAEDALGEARLRAAFAAAGMPDLTLALEPEAAGARFARTLDAPATVLIGDFGGGTSDFSLLRFDPGQSGRERARRVTALGHAGVGLAGDAFDARIIERVISPRLGKGGTYSVMGKDLPVPPAFFTAFARWHRLSLMRAPKTLREIGEVARASAGSGAGLRHLIRLVEDEAGYALYRSVAAAKAALSGAERATLHFRHADFAVEEEIARADFESWIAPDLARLADGIGRCLAEAGLRAEGVDRVFLTGGTSLVPAVRRLFEERFGAGRIVGGGEFVSVAEGLALLGAEGES